MCEQEGSDETVYLYNLAEVIAGGLRGKFPLYLNWLNYSLMIYYYKGMHIIHVEVK